MKTLERAAEILRNACSLDNLDELLGELGFTPPLLPLDQSALGALGLSAVPEAKIVKGEGALRLLAVAIAQSTDLREALTGIANVLARNASQLLWIVVALRPPSELAIVCWRSTARNVRIASLICRRDHLIQSDAETVCMLSAVAGESDLLTHARWLDVLGREAITKRFFRVLESTVVEMAASLSGRISSGERRELALLYVSRLVFLSFLETKGWLNGDFCFLSNTYADCIGNGGRYQRRILEPLFFGTLNTRIRARSARAREFGRVPFLNGGLFARSVLEKQRRTSLFSDEAFGNAFGNLFTRFRFSGREETSAWSDASIDPEILGKAFEALMASSDRKKSGSYYTPQSLVERLTTEALHTLPPGAKPDALHRLSQARILDPACGSGAFLVYVLERLASQRQASGESGTIAEIRRRVLSSSIFGVDLNPMAVWLCELRLWLSIVIESEESDPMKIAPLPNLDRHIRVGDSLAAGSFDDRGSMPGSRRVASVRARYMRAVGPRKRTLARELDRMERAAAIDGLARKRVRLTVDRKEMLVFLRGRDLFGLRHPPDLATQLRLKSLRESLRDLSERVRSLRAGAALPFSFGAHFPDIAAAGGFDCIIGNPPWVRIHRIDAGARQKFRREFKVYRNAPWRSGAEQSGAGRGFAAQVDLSALFVERGCGLARPGGVVAYLLPSKLWRSLAGGGLRELLIEHTSIVMIEDLSDARNGFDAAVYPSLLIARKRDDDGVTDPCAKKPAVAEDLITVTVRSSVGDKRWRCPSHRLSIDGPGSPWLLLPGAVRKAFDRVTKAGVPLRVTPFGRPQLGVKTGCNDAYIVRVDSVDGDVARISGSLRSGAIERSLLRPVIRGETLARWRTDKPGEYIVWPHDDDAHPLRALPHLGREWLLPFRDALSQRTDLHDARRWWSVFRTEGATCNQPRVIWADFGLHPRAMVIADGDKLVPLNTCYVVHTPKLIDAFALAAILNGPLATAWLNAIAEPARGGYRRYLGWTMAMLPVPARWGRVRQVLSTLGERAMDGDVPSDSDLLDAALDAYRLRREKVQPLLDWGIACV